MRNVSALTLAAVLLASAAFATPSAPATGAGSGKAGQPGPNFAAHKQKVLNQIAERIQRLQTVQACVQGAQDHQAMKACREQFGGGAGVQN